MADALVSHHIFTWLPQSRSVAQHFHILSRAGVGGEGYGRGCERELGPGRRAHLHLLFSSLGDH